MKKQKKLLSISEAADLLSVNQDTLRNWEKDGKITPLRVGPRKDRKYRPEDIEKIIDDKGVLESLDSDKMTLAQLKQFLWRSADILRGKIDSSDYKKYIFGLLFYKRISDVWDEEYDKAMDEFKDRDIARMDHNHRFQVPKDCRWAVIQETSENIGQRLNEIFDKLTNANSPKLDKIFDDLDFANKDKFPNETLQSLTNHFSKFNFASNYISSDLLGDAYEYLIEQFAADAGKKGGEFYTPREVERVIINILKPHEKDHVYDPTVGSAGFLLEAYSHLKKKKGEQIANTLYLYGQEQNLGTYAIAKINMFLHGLDGADIRRGDTLASPQFLNNNGSLKTFDIVVANFPYAIKEWANEAFKTNKYGRLDDYEMPPMKNADFAFVLHILKSLNANGRAGVVVPHGILFRGGAEGRIREQIIKKDLLESVIALPPNLFYGTGISAVILIFNKNKPVNRENNILFINAEKNYLEGKNQNKLRNIDIEKIVSAYNDYIDTDEFSNIVSLEDVEKRNFDLRVGNYVKSNNVEEIISVPKVRKNICILENEYDKINKEIDKLLKPLY